MGAGRRVSGETIRRLREARHLLQHDLASNLRSRGFGTTQVTISRWENGQEPRSHVLPALAAELGVTVEQLYGDEEDEEAALVAAKDDIRDELMAALDRFIDDKVEWAVSHR